MAIFSTTSASYTKWAGRIGAAKAAGKRVDADLHEFAGLDENTATRHAKMENIVARATT